MQIFYINKALLCEKFKLFLLTTKCIKKRQFSDRKLNILFKPGRRLFGVKLNNNNKK